MIDLKYDWYQNMNHTFVSYKIKKNGDALKAGGLKVNFTETEVVLENSSTGEILASIELANPIVPAESTFNCSTKKVELKLTKEVQNVNWLSLEGGSGKSGVTVS